MAVELGVRDLAAVRLLQIHAFATDLRSHGVVRSGRKSETLREVIESTQAWASTVDLGRELAGIRNLVADDSARNEVGAMLYALRASIDEASFRAILLEVVTSTDWPKGLDWVISRDEALLLSATILEETVSLEDVQSLRAAHRRAAKRLSKDSISPATQVGLGALMVGAAAISGGAANAIGTAIGTHVLGLSGAAATSAGLAIVGGGSLAAGGFGMAGGTLILTVATKGAASVTRNLVGTVIARYSSNLFVHELAKLDVRCALELAVQPQILRALIELRVALRQELHHAPTRSEPHPVHYGHVLRPRSRPGSVPRTAADWVRNRFPPKEERNLKASERALDHEIRHLEAPEWKRKVATVPRMLGLPSISKLLDHV